MFRRILLTALTALLGACAQAPKADAPVAASLLRDAAFGPPTRPGDPDALFTLSPAMRAFLDEHLAGARVSGDPRRTLIDQLYQRHRLALAYDATRTRTAAEAFADRAGNCLSLVVMTAAFAKALDLPVRYQRVQLEPTLTRSGDLVLASGHVNIALDRPLAARAFSSTAAEPSLVVDFLPGADLARQRVLPLAEATVVAMYANNVAAEALAQGALDDAYAHARAAVLRDPRFVAGWNTLGVVYLRRGLTDAAERVFAEVLVHEPENAHAMTNLEHTLRRQGRVAEADGVAARLAALEPQPPFHFFDAGLRAMAARDFDRARELFAKELRRDAYNAEARYWLGRSELALGHADEARRQFEAALRASTSPREQAAYAAKLDRLRQELVQ
jgi:tetratricopeptide (TPR) repeat protein